MSGAEEFRYLVLAAQREGNRLLGEALKPLGLTPSSAEVIRVLADHGPLSLSAIGELLVCETGMPSRLVARMVDAGFLKRSADPADGRGIVLSLKHKGQAAASRVRTIEDQLHRAIATTVEGPAMLGLCAALWRFVHDRPAGKALALRMQLQLPQLVKGR